MNDDEIRKQNRDDLLERMSESGNAHSSDYPYGLMMEAEEEIKRLRAELKTALDERDDARRMYCIVRMRISNKPEPTDTSQSLGWEGLWQGRPHSNSETRKKTK